MCAPACHPHGGIREHTRQPRCTESLQAHPERCRTAAKRHAGRSPLALRAPLHQRGGPGQCHHFFCTQNTEVWQTPERASHSHGSGGERQGATQTPELCIHALHACVHNSMKCIRVDPRTTKWVCPPVLEWISQPAPPRHLVGKKVCRRAAPPCSFKVEAPYLKAYRPSEPIAST